MTKATPSSLKWLIDKQTRLAGQIQRKRDHIAEFNVLIADCRTEIRRLQGQLVQVEAVMRLHEIQVDPKDLRPIRPHKNKAVLRYGGITRLVFTMLRTAKEKTATTREIVAAVIDALPEAPTIVEKKLIQERVRIRLCILAQQGNLIRLPQPGPSLPCSWRLAMEPPHHP